MKSNRWLPNKLAVQSFAILLLGFLLLYAASIFIFNSYLRFNHSHLTLNRMSADITRAVNLSKLVSPDKLSNALNYLKRPGIHMTIEKQPLPDAKQLDNVNYTTIRKEISKNPKHINLMFSIGEQRWLRIVIRTHHSPWLTIEFTAAVILWIIMLLLLCIWTIRRLSIPFDSFIQSAQRFSGDLNAPPLAETGPEPIRRVIVAFNAMQTRIRALLTNRTQMLAAISHDLKTPITRLKLRVENLQGKAPTEKMLADLDNMEAMITSILQFARNDFRDEPVENVAVNALLASICDDMQDTGFSVKYQDYSDRVTANGRLNALKRAISNLVFNAVKFGKSAEVSLNVRENHIEIKITDNGPGIPENELENVFLPFYRIDKSRTPKKGGSGLGLAIARDIIRTHGGDIILKNCKPHGLSAIIILGAWSK